MWSAVEISGTALSHMKATRPRIGIIHYTAAPVPGGIETLIEYQLKALHVCGREGVVVSGTEPEVPSPCSEYVPLLNPSNPEVVEQNERLRGGWPDPNHPLAVDIFNSLRSRVDTWDQCWVHNAFTVWLNPFLTVALLRLISSSRTRKWVAWSSDISNVSQHTILRGPPNPTLPCTENLQHVSLSYTRRSELARYLSVNQNTIKVISPPISAIRWLGIGTQAAMLAKTLQLDQADVFVFTPSKLLPHKGLDRVVGLAAALRKTYEFPLILVSGAPSPHEPAISADVRKAIERQATVANVSANVRLLAPMSGETLTSLTMRDMMLLADVVFLPSSEEGFGIPLLEAGILRVPILCSDIAVFREVAGNTATYFSDTESDTELAERVIVCTKSAPNVLKRKASASWEHFCEEIRELV
ncbi:MAG: hypothetical protein NVSMB52_18700 [Chloroflexota bacterium]